MQAATEQKPSKIVFRPGDGSGVTQVCEYRYNTAKPSAQDQNVGSMFKAKSVHVATYPEDKELIERVARACTWRGIKKLPKIIIADTRVPNAASINGNTFLFTTGILKPMNGNEIDAIIGHELAHHRHTLRDFTTRIAFFFGLEAVADTIMLGLSRKYGARFPFLNRYHENPMMTVLANHYLIDAVPMALYTRSMEYESDREGADYAGPDHMISALKTLDAEVDKLTRKFKEKPLSERIVPTAMNALRTVLYPIPDHPSTPARVEAIERHRPHAEKIVAGRLAAIEAQNQK